MPSQTTLDRDKKVGDIAYAFEAGDPDQNELSDRITKISRSAYLSRRYHYGGHAFVPKQYHHALGAADMLAWEYRIGVAEARRSPSAFRAGPFFSQLFSAPIAALHFSLPNLEVQTMAEMIQQASRWEEERDHPGKPRE